MTGNAFLDESGEESGKLERGASQLFTVGLVVFASVEEASQCSARITLLRAELKKPPYYEFHFRKNTHVVRQAFLRAVAPFGFTYYSLTLEKHESASASRGRVYLDACARVCALAGDALDHAHLTVNMRESEKSARDRMAADVRRHVNRTLGRPVLSRVRARKSSSENLVQLADYITGVRSWLEREKPGAADYHRLVQAREGQCRRERE